MAKSREAFRTISEVAQWLDTPAHVLRFWESRFSQVKPVKRAGGRRYYRPSDMLLLGGIKRLLHDDGITIKGVQKILREKGVKHVVALSPPVSAPQESLPTGPIEKTSPEPEPRIFAREPQPIDRFSGISAEPVGTSTDEEIAPPPQVLPTHPDRPKSDDDTDEAEKNDKIAQLYGRLKKLRNHMRSEIQNET